MRKVPKFCLQIHLLSAAAGRRGGSHAERGNQGIWAAERRDQSGSWSRGQPKREAGCEDGPRGGAGEVPTLRVGTRENRGVSNADQTPILWKAVII